METNQKQETKNGQYSIKTQLIVLSSIAGAIMLYLLLFHNVICNDQWKVFPKENITFSNSFVNEDDIRALINKYNQSSFMDKIVLSNTPLWRTLTKEGCIVNKEKEKDELSCNCK